MKIKDLTKGKHKYDISKWAKNCPEGAIRVFSSFNIEEKLYLHYYFKNKGKRCAEERIYYEKSSLFGIRYYKEPGIMDYDIIFNEDGKINFIQKEVRDCKTEKITLKIIKETFEIKKFIAKRRLQIL